MSSDMLAVNTKKSLLNQFLKFGTAFLVSHAETASSKPPRNFPLLPSYPPSTKITYRASTLNLDMALEFYYLLFDENESGPYRFLSVASCHDFPKNGTLRQLQATAKDELQEMNLKDSSEISHLRMRVYEVCCSMY